MRKKIFYIGIAIFVIALILFFVSGTLYSSTLSRVIITKNLTVNSGGFAFAPVGTGDASLVAVYAASTNNTNVYLFNSSAFGLWSSHMTGNYTASGLAFARTLGTSNTAVINENTSGSQIILTQGPSDLGINGSVIGLDQFNGTAYVVIDNSKGSYSSNTALKAVVSYFKMTSANLNTYEEIAITELVVILVGIAGIILAVYGAIKKPPSPAAEPGAKSAAGDPSSKEYIDSLYKNVDKSKGKKKGDGS